MNLCDECSVKYRSMGGMITVKDLCNDCRAKLIMNIQGNDKEDDNESE